MLSLTRARAPHGQRRHADGGDARGPRAALAKLPGKTYVILATDGGPNCDAAADCDVAGCAAQHRGDVAGCRAAAAATAARQRLRTGPQLPRRRSDARRGHARSRQSGVPVYVVGVPGSAPYATARPARERRRHRAAAPSRRYYAVNTDGPGRFTAAISSIAATITGTCTLTLNDAPPDPDNVNVFLDENVLPQAGPDGWTLDGETVTILGQSCQQIETGAVLDVRVVAGCPTRFR